MSGTRLMASARHFIGVHAREADADSVRERDGVAIRYVHDLLDDHGWHHNSSKNLSIASVIAGFGRQPRKLNFAKCEAGILLPPPGA